MKVTGETIIFKNDKGYSTSISNKKEDGTYDNMFISVNFQKGIEVANKTKINILDGFMSFYKNKNGQAVPKLVVMSFETENQENNSFEINDPSDLPF